MQIEIERIGLCVGGVDGGFDVLRVSALAEENEHEGEHRESRHGRDSLSGSVKISGVHGHARWVRISHAMVTVSLLTLACSGFVILMAHPRLYWGDVGNDLTPALLELPISRNYRHGGYDTPRPFFERASGPVSASRTYDIFNQNGWGRSLHFLAAWCLVVPGVLYLLGGPVSYTHLTLPTKRIV